MPPNGVIGTAVIEVTVDQSKLRAGLEAAKQTTKQGLSGQLGREKYSEIVPDIKRVDEAFTTHTGVLSGVFSNQRRVNEQNQQAALGYKELNRQVGIVTGAIGRMLAIAGVAAGAERAGGGLVKMFQGAHERARDFIDTLNTSDPQQRVALLTAEIERLQGVLAAAQKTTRGYLDALVTGDTPDRLKTQIEDLQQALSDPLKFQNNAERKKRQEAIESSAKAERDANAKTAKERASSLAEQLNRSADAARLEQLEGVDRALEEQRQTYEEINRLRNEAYARPQDKELQDAFNRLALEKQLAAIAKVRRAEAEREAEVRRKSEESSKRLMEQQLEIAQEVNRIKQGNLDNSWRMVTGIEELVQKLDVISMQMRSMQ